MLRKAVESSSLASVGYETRSRTLEVEFHDGAVYRFLGVPPTMHDDLMNAASKGSFFNLHVRENYPYERC